MQLIYFVGILHLLLREDFLKMLDLHDGSMRLYIQILGSAEHGLARFQRRFEIFEQAANWIVVAGLNVPSYIVLAVALRVKIRVGHGIPILARFLHSNGRKISGISSRLSNIYRRRWFCKCCIREST